MKISKEFALSNLRSLEKYSLRLLNRVLGEFNDMSQGGSGGPYRAGYSWTTLRKHYYTGWVDEDFSNVLNDFENYGKKV